MLKLIPQVKRLEIINNEPVEIKHISLSQSLLSENAVKDFLDFCAVPSGEDNVIFIENSEMDDEEYCIETGEKIRITASGSAGQLYALQTLKQIFLQCDFCIPTVVIHDKPEYSLRGFMLDVGRYFFSVEDVKGIIRRMACHKLNLLHLHLTEDQGWRVEIKKYPLLTEKGSVRRKTNFNHKPHSGFYTQEDIREIVSYAHSFNISVMPELDVPGHSISAIACYNELTCFPRELEVATHWGVKHDVLCAGKEGTLAFVKDIIDELCELFPDGCFHIGGDEVPKHRWERCPHCQAKIKELGLNNCDELQVWFMNELNSYCREKGRQVFMWSWDVKSADMLDDNLGFTKCGDDDCGNRPYIDTSTSACYIDLPYGYISLENSSEHKIGSGNCLGVEATLWSEYVPDMKKADRMTFPRLMPICELGWCGKSSFESVKSRLDFYCAFLDKNGYGYAGLSTAQPSRIRGLAQSILFERRQLVWEGLTNIINDRKIDLLAKKNSK